MKELSRTKLSVGARDFMDDNYLIGLLGRPVDRDEVRDVVAKSLAKEPLTKAFLPCCFWRPDLLMLISGTTRRRASFFYHTTF